MGYGLWAWPEVVLLIWYLLTNWQFSWGPLLRSKPCKIVAEVKRVGRKSDSQVLEKSSRVRFLGNLRCYTTSSSLGP